MSRKLIKSYPYGTKVHYDREWEEYQVTNHRLGPMASYHTDNRLDALGTARKMDMGVPK